MRKYCSGPLQSRCSCKKTGTHCGVLRVCCFWTAVPSLFSKTVSKKIPLHRHLVQDTCGTECVWQKCSWSRLKAFLACGLWGTARSLRHAFQHVTRRAGGLQLSSSSSPAVAAGCPSLPSAPSPSARERTGCLSRLSANGRHKG